MTGGAQGRLRPETSKNFTGGLIFQPSFADLQVSVDYFHIEVDNQIAQAGAQFILDRCYESADFRSGEPYCTLVGSRDPTTLDISQIDDSYLNISRQVTAGVDLTIKYRRELPHDIRLQFDWDGTVTTTDAVEVLPGSGLDDYNGTFGDPKLVWNSQIQLKRHRWALFWNMEYIGGTDIYSLTPGAKPGGQFKLDQGSVLYHDFSVTYDADKWKATIGIRNAFDKLPPQISNNTSAYGSRIGNISAGYGTYDIYGRTFFVNFTKDF